MGAVALSSLLSIICVLRGANHSLCPRFFTCRIPAGLFSSDGRIGTGYSKPSFGPAKEYLRGGKFN